MANFECLVPKYPTGELQRLIFIDNLDGTFTLTTGDANERYSSDPASIAAGSGIIVDGISGTPPSALLWYCTPNSVIAAGTNHTTVPFSSTLFTLAADARIRIGRALTIATLVLVTTTAQPADDDLNVILTKNGVSALAITVVSNGAAGTRSVSGSVACAVTDTLGITIQNLSGSNSASIRDIALIGTFV